MPVLDLRVPDLRLANRQFHLTRFDVLISMVCSVFTDSTPSSASICVPTPTRKASGSSGNSGTEVDQVTSQHTRFDETNPTGTSVQPDSTPAEKSTV